MQLSNRPGLKVDADDEATMLSMSHVSGRYAMCLERRLMDSYHLLEPERPLGVGGFIAASLRSWLQVDWLTLTADRCRTWRGVSGREQIFRRDNGNQASFKEAHVYEGC